MTWFSPFLRSGTSLKATCKCWLVWKKLSWLSIKQNKALTFGCKTLRAEVVRWNLEGKEEKRPRCHCASALDSRVWRHLQAMSRLRLIYGVFSIRIAKQGVKIWLCIIFNPCYI